ncbi:MAG: small conductance mechanosensitive channel [Rickettsiales bacterium]|jgi:small conductance mechanosensitive channel
MQMGEILNKEMINSAIFFGLNIIAALAIFLIGKFIAKKIVNYLRKTLIARNVDETLAKFLSNVLYGLMITFVIITAIGQLGVETTSLAAVVAAAGLAIGFALQGSLSNVASGIMIIFFKPFKIGDWIEAAGISGSVEEVKIFTTKIKTADNKSIISPNSLITSGNITNYSANETRRVDMVFGCSYEDDIKKVKEVLTKIVENDERILKDPEPKIAVSELADSSINFVVRPWVKKEDYWAVKFDITEKVKLGFDQEKISMPYPQRDLHIKSGTLK